MLGLSIFHQALGLIFHDASKFDLLQRTFLKNVSLLFPASLDLFLKFPLFEEMNEFLASKTPKTHKSVQNCFQLNTNKMICLLSFYEILYGKSFEAFVTLNFFK